MRPGIVLLSLTVCAGSLSAAEPGAYKFKPRPSRENTIQDVPPVSFPMSKIEELYERQSRVKRTPQALPDGWSKSTANLTALVNAFELRLKKGYVLQAYLLAQREASRGVVWALPASAEFPEPQDCPRMKDHPLQAPRPPGALDDAMDALEGDESPWSYLCASLLKRELAETGARGNACDWTYHRILDRNPWTSPLAKLRKSTIEGPSGSSDQWQWTQREPRDWPPQVRVERERVTVILHTYSGRNTQTIYRHVDVYRPGNYRPISTQTPIAEGPRGFQP